MAQLLSLADTLRRRPLIASVQASPSSPLNNPEAIIQLAQASLDNGVQVLRLEGIANIRAVSRVFDCPIIGLVKRYYDDSSVYITPTQREVDDLIEAGCTIIALDGTPRDRPEKARFKTLVQRIQDYGRLAMADCDGPESASFARSAGVDLIGTTLAGYTASRPQTAGPDFEALRGTVAVAAGVPVIAEGRYSQRWEIEAALRIGATGVVVGGALNDPVKQTFALTPRFAALNLLDSDLIGAVDIGGTWLRFAVFNRHWEMLREEKTHNPHNMEERLQWIRDQVIAHNVVKVGVSTGGIVDPATGTVWKAKEYLMPNHVGITFSQETLGVPTLAWGDGHATAWAHACLPQFAAKRVATIAIGTGVGCGFVQSGKIWSGPRGEYPRLNDLPSASGKTYEDLLGGIHFKGSASFDQQAAAKAALEGAVSAIRGLYFPDAIVVGGGVGLTDWMRPELDAAGAIPSPLGENAGIFGAAALALFPPPLP